jgi:hypothetical protein
LRVDVVVDDNSTTTLRQKPFQASAFWRRYCITIDFQTDHILALGCHPSACVGGDYVIFDKLHIDAHNAVHGVSGGTGLQRFQNGEVAYSRTNLFCDPQNLSGATGNNFQIGGNGLQIINNDIHHASCGYGIYTTGSNTLIDGNRIHDNAGFGIQVYAGGCNLCMQNQIIRNNVIDNNSTTFNTGWGGVTIWGSENILFHNNIISNTSHGAVLSFGRHTHGAQAYNNTLYNNAAGILVDYDTNVNTTIKNNIIYNSGGVLDNGVGTVQSHNYTTDPQFINAPGGDFHLQPNSPAKTASDTGGEVGAYGNGGGPCTSGCATPTPNPTPTPTPTGTLCSTLMPGSIIGQGFGKPWNVFNLTEMLVRAYCTGTTITAEMGPSTYVYHQGYAWINNAWQQTSYNCTGGAKVSNAWCPQKAQGNLPPNSQYYVAYTCNWTGAKWNCGCADTTCATNYWQLQKIN